MKSTKPYLFEAMYRWMVDSECTPLLTARTDILGVLVPDGYAKDNIIVLDISEDSIDKLEISEHVVTFVAAFASKEYNIRLPMASILAIHTAEEGMGLEFEEDEVPIETGAGSGAAGGPDLRIL